MRPPLPEGRLIFGRAGSPLPAASCLHVPYCHPYGAHGVTRPTISFHPAIVADTGSLHGPFWLRVFTHRIQYHTVNPACAPS